MSMLRLPSFRAGFLDVAGQTATSDALVLALKSVFEKLQAAERQSGAGGGGGGGGGGGDQVSISEVRLVLSQLFRENADLLQLGQMNDVAEVFEALLAHLAKQGGVQKVVDTNFCVKMEEQQSQSKQSSMK
jgi:hypothetical protein